MSVQIIRDSENDLVLTESEYDKLLREYQQVTSMMVNPPTFEEWARKKKGQA